MCRPLFDGVGVYPEELGFPLFKFLAFKPRSSDELRTVPRYKLAFAASKG